MKNLMKFLTETKKKDKLSKITVDLIEYTDEVINQPLVEEVTEPTLNSIINQINNILEIMKDDYEQDINTLNRLADLIEKAQINYDKRNE